MNAGSPVESMYQPPASIAASAAGSPYLANGQLIRVLEDWCEPFAGYFLYYPSRRQQPAALSALIDTLRVRDVRAILTPHG